MATERRPRHASRESNDVAASLAQVQVQPFRPARSDSVILDGGLDRLDEPTVRARVQQRLEEIVAIEGPIEGQRLASLVGQSFGLMRVHKGRADELLAMVPSNRRHVESDREFVWPDGLAPNTYGLVRVNNEAAHRPIETISRVEIGNAIRHILDEPGGMGRDDLRRKVMTLFGFHREGAAIRARLDQAIDDLASRQVLRLMGKFVVLDK